MTVELPDLAKELLDVPNLATVATVMRDGSPQTSLVWATYDGNDILISTIVGRAKERNWQRDPRVSVLIHDARDPNRYVEVRGTVELTTDGGPELIQELSRKYEGKRFSEDDGTDRVRVVARVSPERVVVY